MKRWIILGILVLLMPRAAVAGDVIEEKDLVVEEIFSAPERPTVPSAQEVVAEKAVSPKISTSSTSVQKAETREVAPASPARAPVQRKQAVKKAPAVAAARTPRKAAKSPRYASSILVDGREGHFVAGVIGPGFGVANRGAGAMMTMGVEGEYYFWEHLSAGMRIEVATEFDDTTILSFVPRARYVFDFARHPRWSVYLQGGVGLALYNGKHAAADIAIPGGGFWWEWTDRWSVGADTSLHIFVRDQTAVGFTLAPAIRYQF